MTCHDAFHGHVLRAVGPGGAESDTPDVVHQGPVGRDAPHRRLPDVTMSIHESRQDYRVRGVDGLSGLRIDLRSDFNDLAVVDKDIPLGKDA